MRNAIEAGVSRQAGGERDNAAAPPGPQLAPVRDVLLDADHVAHFVTDRVHTAFGDERPASQFRLFQPTLDVPDHFRQFHQARQIDRNLVAAVGRIRIEKRDRSARIIPSPVVELSVDFAGGVDLRSKGLLERPVENVSDRNNPRPRFAFIDRELDLVAVPDGQTPCDLGDEFRDVPHIRVEIYDAVERDPRLVGAVGVRNEFIAEQRQGIKVGNVHSVNRHSPVVIDRVWSRPAVAGNQRQREIVPQCPGRIRAVVGERPGEAVVSVDDPGAEESRDVHETRQILRRDSREADKDHSWIGERNVYDLFDRLEPDIVPPAIVIVVCICFRYSQIVQDAASQCVIVAYKEFRPFDFRAAIHKRFGKNHSPGSRVPDGDFDLDICSGIAPVAVFVPVPGLIPEQ